MLRWQVACIGLFYASGTACDCAAAEQNSSPVLVIQNPNHCSIWISIRASTPGRSWMAEKEVPEGEDGELTLSGSGGSGQVDISIRRDKESTYWIARRVPLHAWMANYKLIETDEFIRFKAERWDRLRKTFSEVGERIAANVTAEKGRVTVDFQYYEPGLIITRSFRAFTYRDEIAGHYADYTFRPLRLDEGELSERGKIIGFAKVPHGDHGITEIGIERTEGKGGYTFIAMSDGTVRYKGFQSIKRKGKFSGKIDVPRFNHLAQFIRDSEFSELDDFYEMEETDHPGIYVTVVMDGKRKTIRDHGSVGPSKLWAIEELIDNLMKDVKWDERKQSNPK